MDATSKRNSALYHSTASSGDLRWSPLAERRLETPRPASDLRYFLVWRHRETRWCLLPGDRSLRLLPERDVVITVARIIRLITSAIWNGMERFHRVDFRRRIKLTAMIFPILSWMKKWSTSSWVNCPNRWIWIHLYVLLEDSRQKVFTLTGEEEWRSSEGAWCPITVRGHRLTSISSILRSG